MDTCFWQPTKFNQESLFFILLFVFFATLVTADPESNLDFDKELPELKVLSILNDEEWRKKEEEEQQWRKPGENSNSNVRWGGYSARDENEDVPGLIPFVPEVDQELDNRKAVQQFRFKFNLE